MDEDVSFFGEKSMDDLVKSYFKRNSVVKSVVIEDDNFCVKVGRDLVEICRRLGIEAKGDDYSEGFIEETVKRIKEGISKRKEEECKKRVKLNDVDEGGACEDLMGGLKRHNTESKENLMSLLRDKPNNSTEKELNTMPSKIADERIQNKKEDIAMCSKDIRGEKERMLQNENEDITNCCSDNKENNKSTSEIRKINDERAKVPCYEKHDCSDANYLEQLKRMVNIEKSLREEIGALQEELISEKKLYDFLHMQHEELQRQQKVEQNPFWKDSIEKIHSANEYIEKAYTREKQEKDEKIQALVKERKMLHNKIEDLEDVVDGLTQKIHRMKEKKIDEDLDRVDNLVE